LTRRFQPIQVDEPDVQKCCDMLRGILGPMEKHHKVRISNTAIVAAVNLSHRYIPARQLPDKAVSLLDTASARVAISQSAVPAMIEDKKAAIDARQKEKAALMSDSDLGAQAHDRIGDIEREIATLKETLAGLESEWATENKLVNEIRSLRDILNPPSKGTTQLSPRLERSRRPHRHPLRSRRLSRPTKRMCAIGCARCSRRWRGATQKSE